MNDFKNMSEKYRKQMLDLYKRYPQDIPPQKESSNVQEDRSSNMTNNNMAINNANNKPITEEPTQYSVESDRTSNQMLPTENVTDLEEDIDNIPIEERYPTPVIPPFIYQANHENDEPMPKEELAPPADFTQTGYLKVSVTSADGAIPLPNVSVIISKLVDDHTEVLYSLLTNDSGETEIVELPAPPQELSESPSNSPIKPYAEYNISTYLKGYYQVINNTIPVFADIVSIQKVNMIPLPSHTDERKVIEIPEYEPNL